MKQIKEISDKNPFKVPENYFEEVNRKIISATTGFSYEQKKAGLYRKLRPYLAVAASVAIIAVLSYAAIHIFSPGNDEPILPDITLNEFSDHYLNDIDNLTLEESAEIIEHGMSHIDINSSDIIDYLVLENIGINEIYERL
jgi:preprotein translocase subunit Sec61beta